MPSLGALTGELTAAGTVGLSALAMESSNTTAGGTFPVDVTNAATAASSIPTCPAGTQARRQVVVRVSAVGGRRGEE